jgi:Spy/CpxP family protein refolding chaperone
VRTFAAVVVVVVGLLFLVPASTSAQTEASGAQGPAVNNPAINPFELQRLFDSWALLQAQEFLKITDEQFAKFLPRFKALQDVRRQALQQRTRAINELRRLVNDNQSDEQIKNALKLLQDIDDRGTTETRKAYDAVDQVLDLHQQAKFRVFEEQMERRKLELVTRARQANRGNNPNRQR